jgi:hypothetical protein
MKQAAGRYIPSFQVERFFKGVRHHWMICREHKLDELVAWGHAPTQELAEEAARNEVQDLVSGISKGGRVPNTSTHLQPNLLSRMTNKKSEVQFVRTQRRQITIRTRA